MLKKVTKVALVLVFVMSMVSTAKAQTQTDTNCTTAGSSSINCTSTTSPTGPTAAQVEQQKEMNENASKMGAALGSIVAQKRAQHAQEKNDLTAVTFCRQNPAGNWTFPNKAPMPCATLERNVVAYCTVNAKKPICQDVAKLPPASAQMMVSPDEERVTVNVVYCQQNPNGTVTTGNGEKQGCTDELARVTAMCTVREWKGKPCEALSSNKATAIVSTVAPQAQPQSQQAAVATQPVQNVNVPQAPTADVAATPAPEVSVAEAARQARIAKAVREAKEKAERDNPPPQQ
jgi:hypothetical protein